MTDRPTLSDICMTGRPTLSDICMTDRPTLSDIRPKRSITRKSCGCVLAGIVGSNPGEAWMSVCCECCGLSARGFCDGLFTRPEGSYRVWCHQ